MGLFKIAGSAAGNLQLPAAQRAEVKSGASNFVDMTLFFAAGDSGDCPSSVSVPLTSAVARELAIRLWLTADETDLK